VGSGEEDDNERNWKVLTNIQLASSPTGMPNSQLATSTTDESWCVSLQVAWGFNCTGISTKLARCGVLINRYPLNRTTSNIFYLWDTNSTVFDGQDVCWELPQEIPGILYETDAKHHEIMHGYHCYSKFSDGQNTDFTLCQSILRTNIDTNDADGLNVGHILRHPLSCPSTN